MDSYEKVYPSVEELSKIAKNVTCPECSATFNSESNLTLHLVKTHKKSHLPQSTSGNKAYHCPVATCNYHKTAYFKQFKFLKQHYLKVHSERSFVCHLCQKGFSTENFRDRHAEYCNVAFKCCDCSALYNCYETLKTHSRRKKHKILDKAAYKTSQVHLPSSKSDVMLSNKPRLLLPKPSSSAGLILNTSEQASQTDKSTRHNSQETQTLLTSKIPQLTVETQTIGDCFVKKSDNKSIKTQTKTVDPKSVSCNTSFKLEEFELHDVERSSSSTQTAIYDSELMYTRTHDSTHTDTSDLLRETFDTNFFNCNMETQTDFMFQDELFRYCDDYSNMCTQTCEDLFLGLNDIQTQTVFDDMLKSVESQTVMSRKIPLSCKDMSHMETQTDFKKMLEEINA